MDYCCIHNEQLQFIEIFSYKVKVLLWINRLVKNVWSDETIIEYTCPDIHTESFLKGGKSSKVRIFDCAKMIIVCIHITVTSELGFIDL